MRETFQEELESLEALLQEQGDFVLRALRSMLEALSRDDSVRAGEVIRSDDEIDERFNTIEERVQVLLARQTPVATDLRLVLATLHVNLSLERIADYAVTICKLIRLVSGQQSDEGVLGLLETMGLRTEQMIRVAIDSFASRDAERARTLEALDSLVDGMNRDVVDAVLHLTGDPGPRGWALQMLVVARCLERIGDHAVDIGEQTNFLVTGRFNQLSDASADEGTLEP